MTTTTIRIEDTLKARVALAAERAGKTAHAFILDAIAQSVAQAEVDDAFHALAETRWAAILAGGGTVAWSDAADWIAARGRGKRPARPDAQDAWPAGETG